MSKVYYHPETDKLFVYEKVSIYIREEYGVFDGDEFFFVDSLTLEYNMIYLGEL